MRKAATKASNSAASASRAAARSTGDGTPSLTLSFASQASACWRMKWFGRFSLSRLSSGQFVRLAIPFTLIDRVRFSVSTTMSIALRLPSVSEAWKPSRCSTDKTWNSADALDRHRVGEPAQQARNGCELGRAVWTDHGDAAIAHVLDLRSNCTDHCVPGARIFKSLG
ncbi:hypothetical protein XOCgx_2848 [Xanthomonas oryzae pv. oryzicola]|nr:hypothetical protein XOCgx_2848 [Xanthomonas oryzae pv. oryzicola]